MQGQYADAVARLTRRRIQLFTQAGDDWRFAESLKSVSEDTAQEYERRALFELLQNGYDALASDENGRVLILLDAQAGAHGTLYVANEGVPFTESNFKAIIEFGLSNKGAGEGIGNKGLGFRSVLQLTDWPEIYSKRILDGDAFDGYCFRFATPDDIRGLVTDECLSREVSEKVSALALPVPAEVEDSRVASLGRAGYVTVVRLPLRNEQAAQAAREQLDAIADHHAPLLLFLERLSALEIRYQGIDESWECILERSQRPFAALAGADWISEVDLGDQGRFLHAVRSVPAASMREAVESSISAREIDEKWRDWEGDATVAMALCLDRPIEVGRMYTFLPMSSLKERGRVIPEGAGPCQAEGLRVFVRVSGRLRGMPGWPAGVPGGLGCPVSRLLPVPGERPRAGQGPGRVPAGGAGAVGVLDAEGRDPIIGRRGTGGCVVVAAGPMGSSGAGAPGCGHPSGWPAARGRGAWGWSARAAGSIRSTAAPRGAGARYGGDHALPAAGPAHLASCCAVRAVRDLTCPSRIA